jgi:hypothetical protein
VSASCLTFNRPRTRAIGIAWRRKIQQNLWRAILLAADLSDDRVRLPSKAAE